MWYWLQVLELGGEGYIQTLDRNALSDNARKAIREYKDHRDDIKALEASEAELDESHERVQITNRLYLEGGGFEGVFGGQDVFYGGLESYNGRPMVAGDEKILNEMRREFYECRDPRIQMFETGNYGKLLTNLKTEWDFAVEPDTLRVYPGQEGRGTKLKTSEDFHVGRKPEDISRLMQQPEAKQAKLTKAETIGLRLYTGYFHIHSLVA